MKTEVVMERSIAGITVRQKHKTGFYNVADLERFGNNHRIVNNLPIQKVTEYFRSPKSKEFIDSLEKEVGKIQTGGRGRGNEKWVHPFLFIDIALWYSPDLKVKVYQWLYDNLIEFRDNSGESFKSMTKALNENCSIRGNLVLEIKKVARFIRESCGLSGDKTWEIATEAQLKLRDELQLSITTATYFEKNTDKILSIVSNKIANRR